MGSGVANGIEMAGAVLVLFFIGFGLDHWLGTTPWITLACTAVGIVGTFAKAWYGYGSEMDRHAAARRASATTSVARVDEHS